MSETTKPKCPQCGAEIVTPVVRKIYQRERVYTNPRKPRGEVKSIGRDKTFCSVACGGCYQMGCEG